jgi:hypothetical protein
MPIGYTIKALIPGKDGSAVLGILVFTLIKILMCGTGSVKIVY